MPTVSFCPKAPPSLPFRLVSRGAAEAPKAMLTCNTGDWLGTLPGSCSYIDLCHQLPLPTLTKGQIQ